MGLGKLAALGVLAFATLMAVPSARAEEPTGDWAGNLPSGFKVRLHIEKTPQGYSGVLINPSNAKTPLDAVASEGSQLHFAIDKLSLRYDAVWDEQGKAWRGELIFQGTYALALQRASPESLAPKIRRRPQEAAIAANPKPYLEHEVAFANAAAKIDLAGTLSVPLGAGPFPAVVLVSGTGPNTRDEDVDGHKVFAVLADALNRKGIAVLRYDKRGVGASDGVYRDATTADFATDAGAAVDFLMARPEIDQRRVGLLGHSEGGVIAPLVGASHPKVAFIVMMAAPAIRGDALFVTQSATVARLYGAPEAYVSRRAGFDRGLYEAVIAAQSAEAARASAQAIIARGVEDKLIEPGEADGLVRSITSPWQRFFLAHDPAPVLRASRAPVLAVYGGLDAQVSASANAPAARDALKGVEASQVIELPGLNHLLQRAQTGSPQEYADIDETVSPEALQVMVDWISAAGRGHR